jgi:hypothetical protein
MNGRSPDMMTGLINRERRLRNLSRAVGIGLDEEVKRNKSSLVKSLSADFNREITLAEKCIYHDDLDGALYHGCMAEVIHRTLKELEG